MEGILIGTTLTDLTGNTIEDLTTGQMGMLLYGEVGSTPILRGSEVTNTELTNAKGIQFLLKRADGEFESSLVIPVASIFNKNYQAYVSGIAGVYKIGDNVQAGTELVIPTTGEGTISLVDLTDSYQIDNFPATISATKKSTESVLQYLTRVVSLINLDPKAKLLVTALLEVNSGRYQIKFTTLNSKIKLGISTSDIFEEYNPITVTNRRIAKGTGAQMQEIEKELTVFKGNGNYTEDNDLYYKDPLKVNPNDNYNVLSITWNKVVHPSVSTAIHVATPNLLLTVPSADGSLAALYAKFNTPDVA